VTDPVPPATSLEPPAGSVAPAAGGARAAGRLDLLLAAGLALAVLAGNVAFVSRELGFLHKPKQVREYDHWRYIEMARGPHGRVDVAREPPYCWRVLIPALARGLQKAGLSENLSFFAITNASLFGLLVTVWLWLRDLGLGRGLRVTGLLLLGLTQGAVRWFEYQYWMTDPPAVFLLALALYWVRRGAHLRLAATSVVAAFVRETYVVIYPYYLLKQVQAGRPLRDAVLRTAAVAALPVGILAGLRLFITPNQPDDLVLAVTDSMAFRLRHLTNHQPYVLTVGTFGVMLPLLLMFPGRILGLLRRHFPEAALLAAVYATLVISNNTERPLAYAMPVVAAAALFQLRALAREARLPGPAVYAAAVAVQAFVWTEVRFAEIGMSIYQPANGRVVAATAGFWILGRLALRPRRWWDTSHSAPSR
jgi:hypothetical protein